jgi:cell division protease FtsH
LAAHHHIRQAVIDDGGAVTVVTTNGLRLVSQKEAGQVLSPVLIADGAEVIVRHNGPDFISLDSIIGLLLPLLLGLGAFIALRQAQRGQGFRAAKVTAPAESSHRSTVTFADLAGVDECKVEMAEIVEFLSSPQRFTQIGARVPKGILLSGPPGTGKTLLAKAIAGEADVPFFSMSGSAFVEIYVGIGAARVRDLFAQARRVAPAIIFIDELDAVGGKRSTGSRGGNDEREQTLNQLLIEMDGFKGDTGVVVIAATNRPDMLDDALTRPGRFDRRITLGMPDRRGRLAVLALHARRVRMAASVGLERLAGRTAGMSPADLANVINEAALLAARERRPEVHEADLDAALLRVVAGPAMTSRLLTPALKRVVAYHEVGHALVMKMLPHCDPVTKVQAIPRGNALGITITTPSDDQYLLTMSALQDRMAGLMGGRAAEELVFGEVTTGAQQDIVQANGIARRMVMEFGMSELGHISINEHTGVSPDLAARIDEATRALVEDAYQRARTVLTQRRSVLAAIADHLIEVETIEGEELDAFVEADASGANDADSALHAVPRSRLGEPTANRRPWRVRRCSRLPARYGVTAAFRALGESNEAVGRTTH